MRHRGHRGFLGKSKSKTKHEKGQEARAKDQPRHGEKQINEQQTQNLYHRGHRGHRGFLRKSKPLPQRGTDDTEGLFRKSKAKPNMRKGRRQKQKINRRHGGTELARRDAG